MDGRQERSHLARGSALVFFQDGNGRTDWYRPERTLRVYLGQLDDVHVDRVLLPNEKAHECSRDELHRRRSRQRAHPFPRLVLPSRVRGRALV